jgi:hypothetical protein
MAGCSVDPAMGLEIPVGTCHRSISGNEGSLVLNQSIRDPGLKSSQCCGNSRSNQADSLAFVKSIQTDIEI